MDYLQENNVIIGNVENKYNSNNIFYNVIINNFFKSFDYLVQKTCEKKALDVGCGEGYIARRMASKCMDVRACDFSNAIIEEAKAQSRYVKNVVFEVKSVYDLDASYASPLVICCEVLEHLENPQLALEVLQVVASDWLIFSVPREPLWRVLNFIRGRYLFSYGNTPGHIQHWCKNSFLRLLSLYFEVIEVRSPAPWTICLCRKR